MRSRRWTARILVVALGTTVLLPLGAAPAAAAPVDRVDDPVVVTGLQVSPLLGVAPDRVAAFRWTGTDWAQVPVQVDERAVVDFGTVPTSNAAPGQQGTVYGTAPSGDTALQYTDPNTFVGPDPNPVLDRNDEIALMARDGGAQALGADPPDHTDPLRGVELTLIDPLEPGPTSFLYVFPHDGTLDPSAGQALVDYDVDLASGDYRTTYVRADGPNPEDTTVTTPNYQQHFSDRWIDDGLSITAGAATGVDILDRHRNQFFPGECGRSEDTFSDGEGAFVANRVGPVRAIRSYVGANSGPLTERTHIFYESRQEIVTDLRVHPIPGIMDLFDYSPAASGMAYRNSNFSVGIPIDGVPEDITHRVAAWELVRGAPGSLIVTTDVDTSLSFRPDATQTYWLDDSTPPIDQCTGDEAAYGVSGSWLRAPIANTDPRFTTSARFRGRRVLTYRPPGATVGQAWDVERQVDTPLFVRARRFSAFPLHPFHDVSALSWVSPALDWAAHHDLVNGFGGEFRPAAAMRRAQAVAMCWPLVDEPVEPTPHGFPDVPAGTYYDDALDWARATGLVTGYADGGFHPGDPVTRGQAVNLLWQMVGEPAGAPPHGFPDVPAGAFYEPALDWARDQGLVDGFADGTFRPRLPVTRAQLVDMAFDLAGDPDAWTAFGPPPSTVRF